MDFRDINKTTSVEELRRRYDFDSILKNKKSIQLVKGNINKIDLEQQNILKSIIINLSDAINDQSDVSLWFFSGIPSLETLPTKNWDEETYSEHINDFYYDRDVGKVYTFNVDDDNNYYWIENNNSQLIQAMALTNSEIDTVDNLRKVFFVQPTTPYDCGDWYVKDNNLYICQTSKNATEEFNDEDFIIASKYTDDTKANEVAGKLTIVSGQVTTIIKNLDIISQTIEDNRYYVDENGNRHLISETTSQLVQSVKDIKSIFQITGGNNLIKNSVGLFGINNFWILQDIANITAGENSELIGITTSASEIVIQNSILYSSPSNINGLTLGIIKSFSFKIKQDANVTTTIKIYGLDEDQPLYEKTFAEQMEWTEIFDSDSQFYPDSSNLILKIESNSEYGGSVYISDLMLNDGDKQQWQPAASEIWGTVVKLSQLGVSVYAIEGSYVTMMTTDGFMTKELNGNTIGDIINKLTRNGLFTKDIEQTGKHIQVDLVHDIINSNNQKVYIEYIKD